MLNSRIVRTVRELVFVGFVLLPIVHGGGSDGAVIARNNKVDVDPYNSGRQIFDFRRNGVRVDIRVVPTPRNDSTKNESDGFPEFPTNDIGRCIINFSLLCAKNRFSRFLESIRELNEIYLMGQEIKLVKNRVINDRESTNDSNYTIERSVNDFFDTFTLRITLPRWNGKREKNQIDVMLDETALVEGRGKKGGGDGGGKGGGKCKMMMMGGLMMLKMKLMGIATMKGMMMAGMSLMVSMAMLMQKWMKGGGGGGGHGGGGGGGQYKEVVLLTKSGGGGGGGGGGGPGCCGPSDSYGAPPPSSYGPPSGGGGWGRSFGRRFITSNHDRNQTTDLINSSSAVEKSNSNAHITEAPSYGNLLSNSNFSSSSWNLSNYDELQRYQYFKSNESIAGNDKDAEPLLRLGSTTYAIDTDSYQGVDPRNYVIESSSVSSHVDNVKQVGSTNYIANSYDTNAPRPIYNDEWQATEGKLRPSTLISEVHGSGQKSDLEDSFLRGS